jgi:HEAT repeat protein
LIRIAEAGGKSLNIDGCLAETQDCRIWAFSALRRIGTPEAKAFLVVQVESAKTVDLRRASIQTVGGMREPAARPSLLNSLADQNLGIRMESLLALGSIGDRSDFEAIASSLSSFPDRQVATAVHAFRAMGDRRALPVLEKRLAVVVDSAARESAQRALDEWRGNIDDDNEILRVLRTARGQELYAAIQASRKPSKEVRAALLDLLKSEDGCARAESVLALGKMHVPADYEILLEAALSVPEIYIVTAARGLMLLGDQRAIKPLETYAAKMTNAERQRALLQILDRLRNSPAAAH